MTKLTNRVNKFLSGMESSSSKNPGEIKLTQPELQVAKVKEDLSKIKNKIFALFAITETLEEADDYLKSELLYEIRNLNIYLDAILNQMNIKIEEATEKYNAVIKEAYKELKEFEIENKNYKVFQAYLDEFQSGLE